MIMPWFNSAVDMTRNGPTRKRDTIVVGNERKIYNKKCDQKCVYHNKRILMKMLFKNFFFFIQVMELISN